MILLTGGTGFLGRHLVPALCRAGYTVRVLTRMPESHTWVRRYPNVEVFQGDLLNRERLQEAARGCHTAIHAGGRFRFWGSASQFDQTNVTGTVNVVQAALSGAVAKFLYVSSAAVYGAHQPDVRLDETSPTRPVEPYQHSKLQAETAVMRAYRTHGLPVVVLRPGAFYGPLGIYGFNRLFFKDPMRGLIMQINGGRYIIFPAYIQDVVQGILLAMDAGTPGDTYNLCGDWLSHKEAFDIVCEEAHLRFPRLSIPGWLGIGVSRVMEFAARFTGREPFWPINMRSYVYNNWRVSYEKARRELGFEPTSFREGARRTIAWYRAGQPDDVPEVEC